MYRVKQRLVLWSDIPAAAAASGFGFRKGSPVDGLSEPRVIGLLLRLDSDLRAGGDRERRSNLEVLGAGGSVWSKRDRLAVRLSVSSMINTLRCL